MNAPASFALGKSRSVGAANILFPADLARHALILGNTGSGKTVTTERIVHGALAAGAPVVIVDGKGGRLERTARALATLHQLPFRSALGLSPNSLGYNPCRIGEPAQVADKLVSSFTFDPAGEIYRQVAQEAISVLVTAMRLAGIRVTMRSLADALDPSAMRGLAERVAIQDADLARELRGLSSRGNPSSTAYLGMRARLGSVVRGVFGPALERGPSLRISAALKDRAVTHISLPAMASTGDVSVMARILIQDLKQAACLRLGAQDLPPAVVVLDEFAALGDPTQMVDLLRQSREAQISIVVASQQLPENVDLRGSLLSSGLVICHQVTGADAETMSARFGTRPDIVVSRTLDPARRGKVAGTSIRRSERPEISASELMHLPTGRAAVVWNTSGHRVAIVDIEPLTARGVA